MGEVAERSGGADSGAALVEAAISLVVVIALVAGITTVAGTALPSTALDRLAVRAARLATSFSGTAPSDLEVLTLIGAGLDGGVLERLVLYRPVNASGDMPAACADLRPATAVPAGVAGWCTVFGPAHLAAVAGGQRPPVGCAPGSWEVYWCPSVRVRDGSATLGVRIEVRHPDRSDPTGTGAITVSSSAVLALDPIIGPED